MAPSVRSHPKAIGDIPWPRLREEKWRLHTFSNYPPNTAKSAILLAKDGFAYTGSGKGSDDSVICFFCCCIKKGWSASDFISVVHRELSPDCPMVTKVNCNNIPMPTPQYGSDMFSRLCNNGKQPNTTNNQVTGTTSALAASQRAQHAPPAPQSSRTSTSSNPLTTQPSCGNTSTSLTSPDPEASSSSTTSSAPRTFNINQTTTTQAESSLGTAQTYNAQGSRSQGTGRGPTYGDLGIITERPERYEYAVRARRLETFEHWPRDHHLKKEDLSTAGFYYAGFGDCACCFYCGGQVRNWDSDDNVWVEHARRFPKCAFIRQQMGQAFVDTVQDLNEDHDQISYKMVKDKMRANASSFRLDTSSASLTRDPAVKAVLDVGYAEKDVLKAANQAKEQYTILSADKVFEKLEQDGKQRIRKVSVSDSRTHGGNIEPYKEKETYEALKDQNHQLRQQTVCKICKDREVAIVFLPCGHLVSCTDCAAAVKDCPACQKHIKGIVRAFRTYD